MGSLLAEQASENVGATFALALASLAGLLALGWLDLQPNDMKAQYDALAYKSVPSCWLLGLIRLQLMRPQCRVSDMWTPDPNAPAWGLGGEYWTQLLMSLPPPFFPEAYAHQRKLHLNN